MADDGVRAIERVGPESVASLPIQVTGGMRYCAPFDVVGFTWCETILFGMIVRCNGDLHRIRFRMRTGSEEDTFTTHAWIRDQDVVWTAQAVGRDNATAAMRDTCDRTTCVHWQYQCCENASKLGTMWFCDGVGDVDRTTSCSVLLSA